MTTHTVQPGDTLDSLSRRYYGSGNEAGRIRGANPGLFEPLVPGARVYIPPIPGAPTDRPQPIPAQSVDEVAVLIDGKRFLFWQGVEVIRSVDAPDEVTFSTPFDPSDQAMRDTFRPFTYPVCVVTAGGEPLFNGQIVASSPILTDIDNTLDVSAYALPGVLQDCSPPPSLWPVEYDGLDLRQIAEQLCNPFGVPVVFEAEPGPPFGRVAQWSWEESSQTMPRGQPVWPFLSQLAEQRGLVMGTNVAGALVFREAVTGGAPVARLVQGDPPLTGVRPEFSPQQYYTSITAVEPAQTGIEGSQYTVTDPHAPDTIRPYTFEARDTEGGDLIEAAKSKLGRMWGRVATWEIDVAGWRTPDGDLWAPNTTITLLAPGAMVYNETEMLIRSVTLLADEDSQTAVLRCVLPGALSGEAPERLPWD